MAVDDPIPSFLDLLAPRGKATARGSGRTSRKAATRPAALAPRFQLSFDLLASDPASEPELIPPVPEPEPPPLPVFREPILYTVRQLIGELRQRIEVAFTGLLHVEGEVSNCRPAGSGHLYFTLKDGDAQLSVVMFRRQAQLLGFKLRDGLALEASGRISVYESRGQLQLIAESLRPRGTGALQLAFEQLRDRLRAEGLFDRPRTPLPPFPHCVGIVTSASGAALRDIIHVVRRRHSRLNLLVFPAVVQGPGSPAAVARGIRWFNRHPERVDLILIARGGGSLEDLAGFNDEALARVIVASKLPVVSAIGHEIDHTIADFVADLRAPTPSAAAELITAAQHRIEERVLSLERRVHRAGEYHLLRARQRLSRLSAEQVLARLRDRVGRREQRIDDLRFRLDNAADRRNRNAQARLAALDARLHRQAPHVRVTLASRRLEAASTRLDRAAGQLTSRPHDRIDRLAARLRALSPLAVLDRGYAIVYAEDPSGHQHVLRSSTDIQPTQTIRARLARGQVHAVVTEITPP